ncbi:MAG: hypothetical protein M3Y69_08320 [Verrucomicrobiota bacterium]|nr:hypothetical protein [Verrucomicrobiota bacterium]
MKLSHTFARHALLLVVTVGATFSSITPSLRATNSKCPLGENEGGDKDKEKDKDKDVRSPEKSKKKHKMKHDGHDVCMDEAAAAAHARYGDADLGDCS